MDLRITGTRSPYDVYRTKGAGSVSKLSKTEKSKDAVALSNEAKDYQVALKALRDVPDVRQEKVDALKSKLESGEYNVNSMDLAGKLLGSV